MRIEEHVNLLSQHWKRKYGSRVMKVGLSLGLTCPNRAKGGCIFCKQDTFTDRDNSEHRLTLVEQIEKLSLKISSKTKVNKFVAYFQDETSTACSLDYLDKAITIVEESGIFESLIISTRPDYVNSEILTVIKSHRIETTLELGMQTISDKSLKFLNRNHTFSETEKAINLCKNFQIMVGVHLIIGIPGEDINSLKSTISYINGCNIITDVKFHNLVVYKGTRLAELYPDLKMLSYHNYLSTLSSVISWLREDITVSRLFTSNLQKDSQSLNCFPGNKHLWLKDLWLLLKEQGIKQGINSDCKPFTCKKEEKAVE